MFVNPVNQILGPENESTDDDDDQSGEDADDEDGDQISSEDDGHGLVDEDEQPWLEDLFDIEREENDELNFDFNENDDLPDENISCDGDDNCGHSSSSDNPFPEE